MIVIQASTRAHTRLIIMRVPAQLLLSFPGLLDLASATGPESNECKAYPGTPNWPSSHAWASLNKSLGGRLISPSPPGAVCHPGQATYNETQCAEVIKGWSTYDWHTNSPVSVMWDQYTNDTCLPDPRAPCSPQGYPAYVVNASTPEHVKAGVDFGMCIFWLLLSFTSKAVPGKLTVP